MLQESILQWFRPSLSHHLSLRPLLCLFLSGRFRQVLLYAQICLFVGNKWNGFDVIYYEYGALVLDYTTSEKATRVFNILKDAFFDEKQLLVLLLPNIQVCLAIATIMQRGCYMSANVLLFL